jgi:hypothetical protein
VNCESSDRLPCRVISEQNCSPAILSVAACPRCRRTTSSVTPLNGPVDDLVRSGILAPLLTYQPIALQAQLIDFREHPGQQLFRGGGWNTGPLKLPNFPALALDLAAPILNVTSEVLKIHPAICSLNVLIWQVGIGLFRPSLKLTVA